jgi:hypothetical protein
VNEHFLASLLALSLLSASLFAADENTAAAAASTNEASSIETESQPSPDPIPAENEASTALAEPIAEPIVEPIVEAEVNSQLTQLIKLIEDSKFEAAYVLGLSMNSEWEGDEQFDFNFALAAAQTGHYNQAIFAFERLVENHPNNLRFRLELARCYFFLNNLPAAEREFNVVAKSKPPKEVQQQIDRFLNTIAEQKQQVSQSWGAGAGLALGYDSNINAAADIDTINATFYDNNNVSVLTGSLVLNDEQKSTASSYYQLQGYGHFRQPLSKRSSLDASVLASQKDNSVNNDYDLTNLSVNGGLTLLRSNHSIRLGGIARQYWLAGETLQNQLLANLRWQWYFAPYWKVHAELEAGQQDNSQNDALDFNQWQSKLGIQRQHSKGFVHNLQLGLGSNIAKDSENDFQGSNYFSLSYQAQQTVTDKQQVYGLANFRNNTYASDFADDDLFFAGKQREDNLMQITAGWVYSIMPTTLVKLQVNHSTNQSNLKLYDYQRTLIEAGLTLAFK